MPAQPLSLKARALHYLAMREHSRAELTRKLMQHVRRQQGAEAAETGEAGEEGEKAEAAEQIRRVLDELAAAGFLSDERAADALLAAQGRRMGSRRLQQTLQMRGLAPDLVRRTLNEARATEYERALALWRRRFGAAPAADAKALARQMRFLARRGFDGDVIRRVVKAGAIDEPSG